MYLGITLILVLAIAFITYLFILGKTSLNSSPPTLVKNKLPNCPPTPNCVCSEYFDDSHHYIKPINIASMSDDILMHKIKTTIRHMGGQIQQEQDNYLAATFTSSIFGFVDDFQVRVDPKLRVIQVRSASRVGRGDLGVNRKRVEQFRSRLLK